MNYPTSLHKDVSTTICEFFNKTDSIDSILLVNSCARGTAIATSDLDLAILVNENISKIEKDAITTNWLKFKKSNQVIRSFEDGNIKNIVHLDIIDGNYQFSEWDDGGGPDFSEIEIGNQIAHSYPLKEGEFFGQLKKKWLPFYDESLRLQRLEMVRNACLHDLEKVSINVKRELYFQAFDRLYKSFQQFLQALFIKNKVYPIAYNKWIKEQIEEFLNLPELYPQLLSIFSISNISSEILSEKSIELKRLLLEYAF